MSSAGPEDDRTVIRPLPAGVQRPPQPEAVPIGADAVSAPVPVSVPGSGNGDDLAGSGLVTAGDPAPVLSGSAAAPATSIAVGASDAGNALPAGTRLGEFELTGVLGEGGFGIVYTAQDHSLQRRVAIKEYMPQTLASRSGASEVRVRLDRYRETFDAGMRSFINEARLLAQFDHPALVKVYRFWEAYGTAYMVMPLFQGITLKEKLKQLGAPPDEASLMAMLAPLTEALAVLHRENCFHRDIAPDNIILLHGSEQRPLLLDFGAARQVISDMTQALTVILKPGYAPVEQYAEVPEMKQGPWTDVYALAATVHYAVTGRVPPASVGRLMQDNYQPLAEVAAGRYGDGFLRAIDRALAVRPAERTASVDAFRADLGLAAAGSGPAGATAFGGSGATGMSVQAAGQATVLAGSAATAMPASATGRSAPALSGAGGRPAAEAGAADNAAAPRGGNKTPLLAAAAALVLLGGGAAAWFLSSSGKPAATAPSPAASAPAPATSGVAVAGSGASPAEPPPGPATSQPQQSAASTAPLPARPAPPVAPVVTAAGFDIRTEFDRVMAGQSADFKVTAAPLKPSLRIGRDKLAFNVTASRDGFVQVLVLGPDGSLLLLFPNAQSSDNRIKAGQTLKLPQPKWLLDTVEPAGSEDFLVIVSQQPRDYADLSRERDYIFLKLPTGAAGAKAAAGWTRSTPLLLGGLKACPTADCEAYGAAAFNVAIER